LDVLSFEEKFKNSHYFKEFQYDNQDVEDRHRSDDYIPVPTWLEHYTGTVLEGGLRKEERSLLYTIAKGLDDGKTILHVGLWRGAGLALFLHAMKEKRANFIGIDCFDMSHISEFSSQPPVCEAEVTRYMEGLMSKNQKLTLIKDNTLKMKKFPKADVIFIDAGHTKECIINDVKLAKAAINPGGIIIFHDYGYPDWPDIKPIVDKNFKNVRSFHTLAVAQC
jgi:predicted O-methyltransferase YrrM